MSVFNGFQTIITGFLDGFNPDLKVVPIEGKYFDINEDANDQRLTVDPEENIEPVILEMEYQQCMQDTEWLFNNK